MKMNKKDISARPMPANLNMVFTKQDLINLVLATPPLKKFREPKSIIQRIRAKIFFWRINRIFKRHYYRQMKRIDKLHRELKKRENESPE